MLTGSLKPRSGTQQNEGSGSTSGTSVKPQTELGRSQSAAEDEGARISAVTSNALHQSSDVDMEMSDDVHNLPLIDNEDDQSRHPDAEGMMFANKQPRLSRRELLRMLKEAQEEAKMQEQRAEKILERGNVANRHYQAVLKQCAQLKVELASERRESLMKTKEVRDALENELEEVRNELQEARKESLEREKLAITTARIEELDTFLEDIYLCAM